jgi:hypothetical protein
MCECRGDRCRGIRISGIGSDANSQPTFERDAPFTVVRATPVQHRRQLDADRIELHDLERLCTRLTE